MRACCHAVLFIVYRGFRYTNILSVADVTTASSPSPGTVTVVMHAFNSKQRMSIVGHTTVVALADA